MNDGASARSASPRRPRSPVATAVWVLPAALIAVALFVALALAVSLAWTVPTGLDVAVEPAVHAWMLDHAGAVGVARVVTDLGSPVAMDVVTAALAVALWWRGRRRAAVVVVAVRLVELGVETAVKALVDRPRPVFVPPLAIASSSSFPSGHSAGTAAVVGFLLLLVLSGASRLRSTTRWCTVVVLGLFVVAVPMSRVALGVHYPSDVTAGFLLGTACALTGRAFSGRSDDVDAATG